ncbi:MAG: bifunctional hydroxymethylpyrimidine kinase/phosphomethylpyrimidine kinase [Nostoc sp. DedVER02]|uniref:bifunctional hydroxymethylpyrimidine kinase/phosphomethylpyrimidine kinase n=1 Tax=unclassified Nostoc TaxID=2593658 RepID=UPI002AD4EB27|nr:MULTISPECIES: bifunctional hydroxymethylpyrimidine kinase/phosphomethylpyrimidine kinase [unclassified Nostoc]MDZ7987627.1 bifunctional hydroxymethylpyrimidine kinase/phosphomethylpyrimidine kinase [Nostoc sp. DedVER02]MDZ8114218.1 bifunctional hydroxymethylpyrimidine kinase/phosphomethylpyrimidine kinase [Nostoc sp. DedVER01b]
MNIEINSRIPVALTIAGSDSGGGAGIQADLRTFAFHCVHGTSAITCVTAQNTLGVKRVDAMATEAVMAQIQAVVEDIGVQAAKTGMLLNQEIIFAVAQQVEALQIENLVVDPVMVSRTGAQLIDDDAVKTLCDALIPKAVIITPNRYEAQILSGLQINSLEDMQAAAEIIHKTLQTKAVLVKGGGMQGDLRGVDIWFDGDKLEVVTTKQVKTKNTHGTGCTLSAAIAANLAKGNDLWPAVQQAKEYVTTALTYSLDIGKGQGPVGHFFPIVGTRNSGLGTGD